MLILNPFYRATTKLTTFVRTISSQNGKFSSKLNENPADIDFTQAIAE